MGETTGTAIRAAALVTERRGAAVWLRLNRPTVMNAISAELLDELNLALDQIEADETVRVVVLTGTGRAFCAGADLSALSGPTGQVEPQRIIEFVGYAGRTIERLVTLRQPVIAGANGLALAGGLELLLASDIVVASSAARIGDAHSNFGLLPGAGGSVRLPRVVGPNMAKYLAFTGDSFPPESQVLAGLVNEIVEPAGLEDRLDDLASKLATKSPLVLARMKRLIDDSLELPQDEALAAEQTALGAQAHSEDFAEGLRAFAEKRTPNYQGR